MTNKYIPYFTSKFHNIVEKVHFIYTVLQLLLSLLLYFNPLRWRRWWL